MPAPWILSRRHLLQGAIYTAAAATVGCRPLHAPRSRRTRRGRDARTGGYLEFDAAVRDAPLVLRASYWGGERDGLFHIEIDGLRVSSQRLQGEQPGEFIERDYALPRAAHAGKRTVRVRFQPEPGHTAGPVFGCRILARD